MTGSTLTAQARLADLSDGELILEFCRSMDADEQAMVRLDAIRHDEMEMVRHGQEISNLIWETSTRYKNAKTELERRGIPLPSRRL